MEISKRKAPLVRNGESSSTKRSCKQCNQRKVGCDKMYPHCNRCLKAGIGCTYPEQKRAPRKLKRPPISEILAQVKELEEEVERLRSMVKTSSEENDPVLSPATTGVFNEAESSRGRLVVRDERSRYVGDEASVVLGEKVYLPVIERVYVNSQFQDK